MSAAERFELARLNYESAKKDLGTIIRRARESKAISQLCLASDLRLTTPQLISNIERGLVTLPPCHVIRISEVLGLNQSELVERIVEIERNKIIMRVVGGERE